MARIEKLVAMPEKRDRRLLSSWSRLCGSVMAAIIADTTISPASLAVCDRMQRREKKLGRYTNLTMASRRSSGDPEVTHDQALRFREKTSWRFRYDV